jgi:hypothetical protein
MAVRYWIKNAETGELAVREYFDTVGRATAVKRGFEETLREQLPEDQTPPVFEVTTAP